jgi:hypothetical protein
VVGRDGQPGEDLVAQPAFDRGAVHRQQLRADRHACFEAGLHVRDERAVSDGLQPDGRHVHELRHLELAREPDTRVPVLQQGGEALQQPVVGEDVLRLAGPRGILGERGVPVEIWDVVEEDEAVVCLLPQASEAEQPLGFGRRRLGRHVCGHRGEGEDDDRQDVHCDPASHGDSDPTLRCRDGAEGLRRFRWRRKPTRPSPPQSE